jgi:YidC/Oxa1 family membrane protein insertase
MMDRRGFLAIALCILVLVLYQEWVTRYYGAPPASAPEVKEAEKTAAPATSAPTAPTPVAPSKPVEITAAPLAKDIKVETDYYTALFTSHGARLKSFKFKHYRSSVDEKSPPFEIVTSAPNVPLPLGVRWQGATPLDDGSVVYGIQGGDLKLSADAKGTLVFEGTAADGTVITKSLVFSGSTYPIQLEISLRAADNAARVPEVLFTDKTDHTVPNPAAPFEGLIALVDNKIKREPPPEANKGQEFSGDISWAGFGHTYFLFALLPENGAQHKLSLSHTGASLTASLSAPAGSAPQRYTLFVGPKEISILEAVGRDIDKSIDFGWWLFALIAKPLLYVLHFSHRFTASYGIDIILLTILIKLLTAPLTHKSFVSMKQMQKLQPQMEKLKEKFSNDKEKLNKEIMELYRRNGVNPMGGCLPMLLQFPVFIGLYNALSTPIELRHAPFMWIKDLSRPDWESLPFAVPGWWPSFLPAGIPILTLLMGASMFVQQWMTPSAGDPNQRKMMLMMPLMFTFMFVTFPAGLTIYWLVNNILSIGQQYWINRSGGKVALGRV